MFGLVTFRFRPRDVLEFLEDRVFPSPLPNPPNATVAYPTTMRRAVLIGSEAPPPVVKDEVRDAETLGRQRMRVICKNLEKHDRPSKKRLAEEEVAACRGRYNAAAQEAEVAASRARVKREELDESIAAAQQLK